MTRVNIKHLLLTILLTCTMLVIVTSIIAMCCTMTIIMGRRHHQKYIVVKPFHEICSGSWLISHKIIIHEISLIFCFCSKDLKFYVWTCLKDGLNEFF
jgi:tetrahydromethanopterin S-methyltransferase subunit E